MTRLIPPVNGNDHISGRSDARIELVEYGDYECPYCGRAYLLVKNIQQVLGSELKFIFRNFPLSTIHPHARSAAIAAEAAALQNRFWEMHDIIFENQKMLDQDSILRFALQVDMDIFLFKQDIQRKELERKIEMDFESGVRSGVNGTPKFFINGEKYAGQWEGDALLNYLKEYLSKLSIAVQV